MPVADSTPAARLMAEESLEDFLKRHRREGVDNCTRVWAMAEVLQRYSNDACQWGDDVEFRAGDPSWDPFATKRLSVNEIRLPVGAASGRQVMQRFERSYKPRHAGAERFGEVVSAIDKAMMAQADAEQAESAAFRDGPCIQGVSCVRWEYDTLEDRRGLIKVTNWPITQIMWGKDTREINLKDRTWHRAGWWWTAQRVREQWPDQFRKVADFAATSSWGNVDRPGLSSRTPWAGGPAHQRAELDQSPFYSAKERIFWVEYEEWRELTFEYGVGRPVDATMTYAAANARYLEMASSGQPVKEDPIEEVTMTAAEVREFKAMHFAATGEEVPKQQISRRQKVVFKYAYIIGGKVMETGDVPVGKFTFLFMTGRRRPAATGTRWIGLAEDLIPQQRLNNFLLIALYKNLGANPKGVFVYEKGIFHNRDDALDQWTKPGGIVEVKRGTLTSGGQPFQFIAGGTNAYHTMLESLFSYVGQSIPRLAGFNAAALGQLGPDLRRISGSVVRQQGDAAIQNNPEMYDSWRLYRREGGRLFIAFISTFWGDRLDELAEIVGPETLYTIDEETGEPIHSLPPAEMWAQDAWRSIDIQEVVPDDDRLDEMWNVLGEQGVFQVVQQAQADTGRPLFSSLDLVNLLPKLRAAQREEMRRRIKKEVAAKQAAEVAAQQAAMQGQPPPGGESPPEQLPVQ